MGEKWIEKVGYDFGFFHGNETGIQKNIGISHDATGNPKTHESKVDRLVRVRVRYFQLVHTILDTKGLIGSFWG